MTLVRRYVSSKASEEFNGALGVAKTGVGNGDLKMLGKKHATTFQKSYPGNEWSTGISFDFFSVQTKPAIAINVTPSKLADDDWADFLALLTTMFPFGAKQVWNTFRLSRLEIAVDVKVPFNDLVCLVPKVAIVNKNYLKKGTLYLGHKYGRRNYCIYDKRKQIADKESVDLGHDLTRVEVRLRHTGKTLGQLGEVCSPFGNLMVLRKSMLIKLQEQHPHSIVLADFVTTVLAGGVAQQAYLNLEPYSRKQLMKLLKPKALNLNAKIENWAAWIAKQHMALQARFLGCG